MSAIKDKLIINLELQNKALQEEASYFSKGEDNSRDWSDDEDRRQEDSSQDYEDRMMGR